MPFVVSGISASSSSTAHSSASSSSSSQEVTSAKSDSVSDNRDVEAPVSERNRGMKEELQNKKEGIRRSTKRLIAQIA